MLVRSSKSIDAPSKMLQSVQSKHTCSSSFVLLVHLFTILTTGFVDLMVYLQVGLKINQPVIAEFQAPWGTEQWTPSNEVSQWSLVGHFMCSLNFGISWLRFALLKSTGTMRREPECLCSVLVIWSARCSNAMLTQT